MNKFIDHNNHEMLNHIEKDKNEKIDSKFVQLDQVDEILEFQKDAEKQANESRNQVLEKIANSATKKKSVKVVQNSQNQAKLEKISSFYHRENELKKIIDNEKNNRKELLK